MRGNSIFIGIFAMSAILLAGLFYVLKVSFANPVEMANDYQMTYRDVDKNYDKIVKDQKLFDSKFIVENKTNDKFSLKGNTLAVTVKDHSGAVVSDINVSAVITRPDTTKLDLKLPQFAFKDGKFVSNAFDLPKEGRWQVSYKLLSGNVVRYINFEGFAKASN